MSIKNYLKVHNSRWIGYPIFMNSRAGFYFSATLFFLRRFLRGKRGSAALHRTPSRVAEIYDRERSARSREMCERSIDLDEYVFGSLKDRDYILISDKTIYESIRVARMTILSILVDKIRQLGLPSGTRIAEFGSGDGRNLLYLKTCFPTFEFKGYELSNESVKLSIAAANRFGIDVGFEQYDLTTVDYDESVELYDVCYTVHALEQLPVMHDIALRNILRRAKTNVLFLEPIHELYGRGLRDLLSRYRVIDLQRLSGFLRTIQAEEGIAFSAARLGVGDNPFNQTCCVEISKRDGIRR